jgi:lipoprotein
MRRLSEVIFRGISLTIVAASLGLSGCAVRSDQEPAPSASWEERKIHDAVTIDVPDGWVLVDKENRPPSYDLVVAPNLDRSPPVGVWIKNYRADIGIMHGPDVDMKARRDQNMADAEKRRTDSFIEPLGPRQIGGSEAWGYASMGKIIGEEGKLFPNQTWLVWREDGLWRIEVRGFSDTNTIPAELIGMLDTISFIRPTATPAATYTINTESPAPTEPLPSPTTGQS